MLGGHLFAMTRKPQTYNGDISKLPPALMHLRDEKVWLCWRWFWNGKKFTKPPYRADDPERHASTSDPTTWGSYEEAIAQVQGGKADGIGFALKGRNIGGIDLDHCRDPITGQIDSWADDYINRCTGAYVESTVSGKGLRILGTGELKNFATKFKSNGYAVELFCNSHHYLTLSCNQIGRCMELPPIGDMMTTIAAELGSQLNFDFNAVPVSSLAAGESEEQPDKPKSSPWNFNEEAHLRSALGHIPTDESALAEKFGHAHSIWVNIGRAIERLDWGERGFSIWRDWSAQNTEKFNEKGLRTQWNSFQRNRNARGRPTTIATVFRYAMKCGWSGNQPNQPDEQADTDDDLMTAEATSLQM